MMDHSNSLSLGAAAMQLDDKSLASASPKAMPRPSMRWSQSTARASPGWSIALRLAQ